MKREIWKSCGTAWALLLTLTMTTAFAPAAAQQQKQTATRPTPSDVKIRQRLTSGGNGAETVMYIKGPRMRSEMATTAAGVTTVVQCDLKRTLMINEKTKTYLVIPMDGPGGSTAGVAADGDGGGSGRGTEAEPPK